jgi:hypothetical protein
MIAKSATLHQLNAMEKAIFLQIFDAKSIKSPLINISQIALHQMNANGQFTLGMLLLQIKLTRRSFFALTFR